MRSFLAPKEEWEIFKILCPKEIMEIYMDENISLYNCEKMLQMLSLLGLDSLCRDFMKWKYLELDYIEETLKAQGYDVSLGKHCSRKEAITFAELFLCNIKSDGLRRLFSRASSDCFNPKVFAPLGRNHIGMHQEWEIFKLLCPKEIMEIIENDEITFEDCAKVIRMMSQLGFENIAQDVFTSTLMIKCFFESREPKQILSSVCADDLIESFLSSLQSPELREIFSLNLYR